MGLFGHRGRTAEFVPGSEVKPPEPPALEVSENVSVLVDTPAVAHHRAILDRYERACLARDAAVELNARAERAMVEAITAHDEARLALRRVAEGR